MPLPVAEELLTALAWLLGATGESPKRALMVRVPVSLGVWS